MNHNSRIMENRYPKNQHYIVRCDRAGVFFGRIKNRNADEVEMEDVRRLWYWEGAASLSQMAIDGVKSPEKCKFTQKVHNMVVLGAIEIIPCTDAAASNLEAVPEWKM